jgi:hypothetical protein
VSYNNGDHDFDHLYSQNTIDIGNVAYNNYKDGFSIEGTSSGTHLNDCIAINNGLNVAPADGVLEYDLWVDSVSSSGFVSDYNIFWNSTSQYPVKFISTRYTTVAAYSAATGQDVHSRQLDPKFVDPANGNFHLQAGSPAIDCGISSVANWPAMDADGLARVDDPSTPNTGSAARPAMLTAVPSSSMPRALCRRPLSRRRRARARLRSSSRPTARARPTPTARSRRIASISATVRWWGLSRARVPRTPMPSPAITTSRSR